MANLSNGSVPVVDENDILNAFPQYIRDSLDAPVRDAIVAALLAMYQEYQDAASYAAAQSDVLSAVEAYLDAKLEERQVVRHQDELDDDYRSRGLARRAVVSPRVICAAVNAIISPLTCSYLEPALDQLFLYDDTIDDNGFQVRGAATWDSFLDVASSYPDRLYPDDAPTNGGLYKQDMNPGPAALYDDTAGNCFVLVVPDLSKLDQAISLAYNGQKLSPTDLTVPELGGALKPTTESTSGDSVSGLYGGVGLYPFDWFAATGVDRCYMYQATTGANKVYDQIVATVEALRGGCKRWMLLSSS